MREFLTQLAIAASLTIGALNFLQSNKPPASIAQSSPQPQPQPINVPAVVSPRLHKMSLEISKPEDLKVAVGDAVSAGQVIADQNDERSRLILQKEQLTLSLKRVEGSQIIQPTAPRPVPELAPLPPFSTAEYEAAINKAELELRRSQATLDLKQRQIDYLRGIQGIDPAILEHESAQLSEAQTKLEVSQSELDLTTGKLETAKNERKQQEYQHQLNVSRRVEEENKSKSFYQNQLAEAQNAQRVKDYQLTDLKLKLSSVDDKLAQLSVIRSPYAGQIKRIKFVGQSGNKLNVELSLIVGGSDRTTSSNSSTSSTTINPLIPGNAPASTNNSDN
ncbi:MAG TPA: hypothetical protein VK211_29160 [Kamptonema sp.]|nr:hypothetical protein [Kamptonema sp.]